MKYIRRGEEGVRASDLGPSENQARIGPNTRGLILSVYRLGDYFFLLVWGGSRGRSGGSVEPPKLRSQTPIINNMLFLMLKSHNKWVNNYSIF